MVEWRPRCGNDGTELTADQRDVPDSVIEAREALNTLVEEFLNDVARTRERRHRAWRRLLQELTPQLRTARTLERELDRHLARRFNAFRYLHQNETGLSRVIADLLDPEEAHGQGTTFLEAILELLGIAPRSPHPTGAPLDSAAALEWKQHFAELHTLDRQRSGGRVRVMTERGADGRFIDITVDVPTPDGNVFCLAFENKPYAEDQPNQCSAYMKFLHKHYCTRFALVYLPARHRFPAEHSLTEAERTLWKDHFIVLPWVADDPIVRLLNGDESHAADARISLAEWFGICCTRSDPERIRWFLREAQLFCQQHFGASTMTDTDVRHIHRYLDENPEHLEAAYAVARAWEGVRHDIARRFLEHLRDRLAKALRKEMPDIADDLLVRCQYGGDKAWTSWLYVCRPGWKKYEGVAGARDRTAITLESGGALQSWIWGIRSPKSQVSMTEGEQKDRQTIEGKLSDKGLACSDKGHCPHIESVPQHSNWNDLIPEFPDEIAGKSDKITRYYIDRMIEFARIAIPIIDEVEGRAPGGNHERPDNETE